jgi:alanine racemase
MSPPVPAPGSRAWVEVDLAALDRNVGRIKAALPSRMRYVAVVKANAYGHGMPEVVARLLQAGIGRFAVANVEEAALLREIGPEAEVLVLSPALPEEHARAVSLGVDLTLSSLAEVAQLAAVARAQGRRARVHLKVDTGMGRAGVWHRGAGETLAAVLASPELDLRGLYTHFANADGDPAFTAEQRRRFLEVLAQVPPGGRSGLMVHADNSSGLDTFAADSPFNAVRVGLLQYGLPPHPGSFLDRIRPEPLLAFHSRIILVKDLPLGTAVSYGGTHRLARDSRVAVVAAGYGDGIPTAASNRGKLLVRGRRCPILGRVTMDQTLVDVTDVPGASVGDVATILGSQGDDRITVGDFCAWSDCIPWEALCSLTQRVRRVYRTDRT